MYRFCGEFIHKDNDDIEDNDLLVNMNKEELESREDETDNSLESLNVPRRSTRNKRTPVRYPEKENICEIHANYCRVDILCTFEEAICCEDSEDWKQAMDKEIECLYKNKTWKLVERVKGKDVLDEKWVYTRKSDERYKARLVVRGFQQRDVADDIYSPVASNQNFKILLSYCCQNGLIIEQMNVECCAYIHMEREKMLFIC